MLGSFVFDVQFMVVSDPAGGEIREVRRHRLIGMRKSERPARKLILREHQSAQLRDHIGVYAGLGRDGAQRKPTYTR